MSKKKVWITLSLVVVILLVIVAGVLNSGIIATAKYSSQYNKTFGEFTATTASKLLKDNTENTCYSPVSLFAALSLVAECTEGDTQEEVMDVLGVSNLDELNDNYEKMLKDIKELSGSSEEKSVITLMNSLWILEAFMDDGSLDIISQCEEKFYCDIFECKSFDEQEINGWVADGTNNLIKEMVDEKEVKEMTMALINTLYYKSSWFQTLEKVGEKEFFFESGEKVNAEFIGCSEEELSYKECSDFTMVKIPMEDGEMILALPKEGKKLKKLTTESKLNKILSLATSDELDKGLVTVSFPMYEIEAELKLDDLLKDMGMETIYGAGSQWSLSEKLNGQIFKVKQKTKIIVNDKGVEAAAATQAATYLSASDEALALELKLDRPFLYILMKDGVPLFIGTVYNPAE